MMATEFLKQVDEFIRARYTTLYVVTWEEQRAMHCLAQVARKQEKDLFEWTVTDGLRRVAGSRENAPKQRERHREVLHLLNEILQASAPAIYVLKDFHPYLKTPEVVRQIRDLHDALRPTRKTLVILSPKYEVPDTLEKALTVIDMPLPNLDELRKLLEDRIAGPSTSRRFRVQLTSADMDSLVKAARGLTLQEAENAFAKAIVKDSKLAGEDIEAVLEEKKQIIRKSGLLEYYEVSERMDDVGGMDTLKDWLSKRVRAFGEEARRYGLPAPRGVLLMGIQGCGKSLIAKSVASEWRLPLLRMDMSRIFQGYIGSSEENMRRALQMAETLAPIILWIDEIEKALSGIEGSSGTDGGTTARVIGQFLTWMQERTAPVFIVATANSVKNLPPELIRKGRIDEIFFVDLPRSRERVEILQIHLRRLKRDPDQFDLHQLVDASKGFSGAEIEQALIAALHDSFFDKREVETRDIVHNMRNTVPLSKTMREKVRELRDWAADRARPVSSLQVRRPAENA